MQKQVSTYSINVLSEDSGALRAQILFYGANNAFVGRIDFHRDGGPEPPASYLWHPTSSQDTNQIYLVLHMRMSQFSTVVQLLRTEGPWSLELWPSKGPLSGASTPGYGGKLFTASREPAGEDERAFQTGR